MIEAKDVLICVPTMMTQEEIAPLMCDLQGYSAGAWVEATCCEGSAAENRNRCIVVAQELKVKYVVMVDDDIGALYDGWYQDLIKPLVDGVGGAKVVISSARLINADGSFGAMMFCGDAKDEYSEVPRVPTACIAFRLEDATMGFYEGYKGSGFEDDEFCAAVVERNPGTKIVVCQNVRIVHQNEMKNQHGKFFEHNKALFESRWETVGERRIRRAETTNFNGALSEPISRSQEDGGGDIKIEDTKSVSICQRRQNDSAKSKRKKRVSQ